MKKLIIKSLFIALLLSSSAIADVLKKIEIIGNDRVNTETIKIFTGIKINDNLNDADLNQILKNLYETNFFENVEVDFNDSLLKINVKENQIIQNLNLIGIKNKDVKKDLLQKIILKEKQPFTDLNATLSVNLVKNILQDRGYYFSDVNLKKKINENNTIDLIFDIELGKKAFIKKITFLGDKKYKKRKLINIITSEENKFWKIISKKRLLNKQRLELDKRLLLNFYKDKGYYNVKILDDTVQYNNEGDFNIIFNIDAGQKFLFGKLVINKPNDVDPLYFEKIENKINKFTGKKYSLNKVEKVLNEIEKIALNKNYEFLDISLDENITKNNEINISINLKNKDKNIFVKQLNIFGNNITIEDVIRNELIIDEGDPLNTVLYTKSINNIKSLNIFKDVTAEIIDTDDELEKIININVQEKPTGQVSLGAGIGTSGASTSFGVAESNFLGKGIKLNSNISLSEESIRGLFSYTKENYKNSNKDLIFSLQSQEVDRLKNFGYKTSDTGFLVGTNFEYREDLFFSPQISFNLESLETSSDASALLKKQEGSYQNLDFVYSFFLDKRDKSFQTTDGYYSRFSQTLPVITEDSQTVVNIYELKNFHEYINDQIISVGIFLSAANSFGDDDVRISDRLYLPSSKLRGFESGRIGPLDNGDFVGGNYASSFNAQANLPLLQSFETMDFNIFYDAANVWGVDYDSSINDSNEIRSAAGIGVDWYTPIGPLSFSLSQPITKKSTDKTETFRFNLGTTF
jgi:outer membrane protein insertion porin family